MANIPLSSNMYMLIIGGSPAINFNASIGEFGIDASWPFPARYLQAFAATLTANAIVSITL